MQVDSHNSSTAQENKPQKIAIINYGTYSDQKNNDLNYDNNAKYKNSEYY